MVDNYNGVSELVDKEVANDDVVLRFTKESVNLSDKQAAAAEGIALCGLEDTYDVANVNPQGGCRIRKDIKTKFEAFPRFKKYRIWDGDPNGTILLKAANGNVGFADAPVMRYAEMPLIVRLAWAIPVVLLRLSRTRFATSVLWLLVIPWLKLRLMLLLVT